MNCWNESFYKTYLLLLVIMFSRCPCVPWRRSFLRRLTLQKSLCLVLTREPYQLQTALIRWKYVAVTTDINIYLQTIFKMGCKLCLSSQTFHTYRHVFFFKVLPACKVFSHSTASAIRLLVHCGHLPKEALTTAWFIDLVNDWFDLMTSRVNLYGQ